MAKNEFIPTAEVTTEHIVRAINELREMIVEVDQEVHLTMDRVDTLAAAKKVVEKGNSKLLLVGVLAGGAYLGYKFADRNARKRVLDMVNEWSKAGAEKTRQTADKAEATVKDKTEDLKSEPVVEGHPS